ncbi:LLM class oxidoreductase [Xenorhabdus sp. 12]|uniref:LLM class oxidoreductase n=1 Tax=Xenorhabdus santafensis TaxID=2582833 RepID=A0ABU4S637_9GAMM|nr:LLM class oxidoreductase [Xenorhabdus sp. 12]MDX7986099.1 LLM class oxidoreductase [Xenorhabdus sp. 12]
MSQITSVPSGKIQGSSSQLFSNHPGYQRMFRPNELTIGLFLPQKFYQGDMKVMEGQSELVVQADKYGFASVWVRDVPLFDPSFGDAGQLFDPFTYLAYLSAKTKSISLATGSAIFSLRHPIDLAKAATTIDQISGGRLVLGIASGDRAIEFPAYGVNFEQRGKRFADTVTYFRQLMKEGYLNINSPLGAFTGAELLPKPTFGAIPLIVTGASRQSLDWIAEYADGWLTYPEPTHNSAGPRRLAEKIKAWRSLLPANEFRPHMTNDWIDLVEDPNFPRTPLRGGFTLKTGRNGLIDLLNEWKEAGVNHAALGIHFSERPAQEILQEMAEYVLPHFPSHEGVSPLETKW